MNRLNRPILTTLAATCLLALTACGGELAGDPEGGERDEMFEPAVRTVIQEGKCSITLIQRRLQLGYARAARIVDIMEREGIVSAGEGSKPREILVGSDYLEETEAAR